MNTRFSISTAALVTLLFLFTGLHFANADILSEYSCNANGKERIMSLRTRPTSNSLCDVYYQKPDEGFQPVILWRAENDLGFCEEKLVTLVDKLTVAGWSCQANTLAEARPEPQESTIKEDSDSKPEVEPDVEPDVEQESTKENNARESKDGKLTWEEYSVLLAAQEESSETSIDSIGKIYKDYFDQCYEGTSKNENQLYPFDLCNCMIGEFWRRGIDSETIYSLVHDADVREENGCSKVVDGPDSITCETLKVAEKFEIDISEGCERFVSGR